MLTNRINESQYHTIAAAAAQCKVTTRALYALLREEAWLHTGRQGEFRDAIHNCPKKWTEKAGYIFGEQVQYKLKGTDVKKWETKPLITPSGLRLLKNHFFNDEPLPQEIKKTCEAPKNSAPTKPASRAACEEGISHIRALLNTQ